MLIAKLRAELRPYYGCLLALQEQMQIDGANFSAAIDESYS